MKTRFRSLLIGVAFLLSAHSVRSQIVVNGGFETGDFTGWTLSGDTSGNAVISAEFIGFPQSGNDVAAFGAVGGLGFISQNLATTPGALYTLSFWLNCPDGLPPNEAKVLWNGKTLLDDINLSATGWTNLQFLVTATATNTVLEFGFRDDPSVIYLDDVAVTVDDYVAVNTAPLSGLAPLTVRFTSSSVDNNGHAITNWNWDFGDGSIGSAQNPTHVYAVPGAFTPSLLATNNLGAQVLAANPSITVFPANDNFSTRTTLTTVALGNNYGATTEAGEPNPGGSALAVTNSVWWSWTAPTNGPASVLTLGSAFDTIIDIYTNSTLTNLGGVTSNLNTVLNNELYYQSVYSGGSTPYSPVYAGVTNRVGFTATAGTTYQIQVSGLTAGPIDIAAQPVALKVVSVNTGITNADGSLNFTGVVEVGNSGGLTPGPLELEIRARPGYSYDARSTQPPTNVVPNDRIIATYVLTNPATIAPGTTTNIAVSGVCPAPISVASNFQNIESAGFGWGVYAVLREQFETNWFFRDTDLLFYNWPVIGQVQGTGAGVIRLNPGFQVNPNNPGYVQFSLQPSAAVQAGAAWRLSGQSSYSTSTNYVVTVTSTNAVAVEFKPAPGFDLPASQAIAVVPGVLVTQTASYTASAPGIGTEPISQIVPLGSNAQLRVTAFGAGTLTYQWLVNGKSLSNGIHLAGAGTNALALENVVLTNAGSYSVIVSNSLGVTTSAVAVVTVVAPCSITAQPANQTTSLGGKATFSVKAAGSLLGYQWYYNNAALSDNAVIAGSKSNQLSVNFISATNAGSYYVVVANPTTSINSKTALLILTPEKSKPSVAIAAKLNGSRTLPLLLTGTASDPIGVQSVKFALTNINGVSKNVATGQAVLFAGATTGAVSWSLPAPALPGTNILTVQSFNFAGLSSPPANATFFIQELETLALRTNPAGTGVITGTTSVKGETAPPVSLHLYTGEGYTLTAAPIHNWWFTNWTTADGTVLSTNPTLRFTMEPNLSLTANFATNLFIGMAGRYDGVFLPEAPLSPALTNSGLVYNLILGTNGLYSCQVHLADASYSLSGGFNMSGFASNLITRAKTAGGNVSVEFNILYQTYPEPRQIAVTVSGTNGWVASANLCAAGTNLISLSSNYTMLLPQNPNAPGHPPSFGYALLTNISHSIHLAGVLSDGTAFSDTAMFEPINEMKQFPVYASLYNNTGLLLGELSLDPTNATVPAGSLSWFKPAQKGVLYPAAFGAALAAQGSPWTNSAENVAAFNLDQITISGGGLSSTLEYGVSLTAMHTLVQTSGSPGFAGGSINPADGAFTLSFTNTSGKKVTASGALLQNSGTGGGFFLGTTNAGTISVTRVTPQD